jgi:hypothetical protein
MAVVQLPSTVLSLGMEEIRRWSDVTASQRARWRKRAAFFHSEDLHYLAHPLICRGEEMKRRTGYNAYQLHGATPDLKSVERQL